LIWVDTFVDGAAHRVLAVTPMSLTARLVSDATAKTGTLQTESDSPANTGVPQR